MSWLTSSFTNQLLDRMTHEHAALVAAEARRAPLVHRCGCCGQTAHRVETIASGEIACYVCDSCGQRTFVDLTGRPRVPERA